MTDTYAMATTKLVARMHRLEFMEKALRTGKVSSAPCPQVGYAAVLFNGSLFTESEAVYPSDHMVAQIALATEFM
jgi:hypothetical protein